MNIISDNWKDITDEDIHKVAQYMASSPIGCIDGGEMQKFEENFAKFIGKKYAVAYSSGTAALHAAVSACDCIKGKNIILSEYSYLGAVYAALENQAKVILCPFDEETLTIDTDYIEAMIDKDTQAILITHIWGNPCNMDKISHIREKYGVCVISDASHAHGAEWMGQRIGGLECEDISCFSLGKGKLITGGELGVAVTDDEKLYDKLLMIGHPNRVPLALKGNLFSHYSNGYGIKLRPHILSMVIGNSQLEKYPEKMKYNISTNEYLESCICEIPGFKKLKQYESSRRVYWKLLIKLDKEYWKDWTTQYIAELFANRGIGLEQFHNYDFGYEADIEFNKRYDDLLVNKSNMNPPDNIIVLPTMVKLSHESMESIISVFREISELREKE